jgi:hypothetical protein
MRDRHKQGESTDAKGLTVRYYITLIHFESRADRHNPCNTPSPKIPKKSPPYAVFR